MVSTVACQGSVRDAAAFLAVWKMTADAEPSAATLALITACRQQDRASAEQALTQPAVDACFQEPVEGQSALMLAAEGGDTALVQSLLEKGAPWNATDRRGNCAGDYAARAGHEDTFEAIIEAGCRAELLLAALERKSASLSAEPPEGYLRQQLHYDNGGDGGERLMDAESCAVMMSWEGALMQAHAATVCSQGGDILNVGFGLGLVDDAIQSRQPRSHTIIEAHPDVHARMLAKGWADKPGVIIVFGRWQDVLPQLGQFDGIFFDTYSEYYEDLRQFHLALPKLLRPDGIYSFFNGLAATNATFHTVCCRVVAGELARMGISTQFIPLPIDASGNDTWKDVTNKYWQLDTYLLPVCQWDSEEQEQDVQNDDEERAATG
ncbi:hypothetical protein WJX73_003588 [Symbiochloris irregularis]|uniref:RMT2 domain-containing protein n=1 Tax=Symbiochloris irregularis TaxID=706552 RepID=A0AAW1NT07_9CHLO